jgi:pimeloyl-ACP methyl ester carboxylesterase
MVLVLRPILLATWVAALFLGFFVVGPEARGQSAEARRPLIFVPGLLGSRLCRPHPDKPSEMQVAWGTLTALPRFPSIRLSHDQTQKPDDIKPCGLVREIVYLGLFTQEVYAPVLRHLEQLGYRENRDLFIFDYDWRRSIFDNAETLDRFVREKAPDQRVDILAHSMGGLVARVYTAKYGGAERVARLISAGTPFLGSVKVYETVEKGWGALNVAMGGLPAFRRTMLSFPAVFELMPRYAACCGPAGTGEFVPANPEGWSALGWDGVDIATMPNLPATFTRVRALEEIIATRLPQGVEDVVLIGVDQRTPQRVGFGRNRGATVVRVQTTWAGDGTVLRESAALPRATLHPTSFAVHERILNDPQIQEFLRVALTKSVSEALDIVKVRPRGNILTADGSVTELVGIVVEPDEPIYRTGDLCKVRVHVRLGSQRKLSPQSIKLTRRMPDGRAAKITLKPDRAASDPSNPFEQSFVGTFEAGVKPGNGMLRAVVDMAGEKARLVERPVPVIAR